MRSGRDSALVDELGDLRQSLRSRWSALAGTEPGGSMRAAAVLCVFCAAFVSAAWRALGGGERSAIEIAGVVIVGAGATAALALARHLRGRMALIDAVHPLLWILPGHFRALSPVQILASACVSGLALVLSCGWRPVWSGLRQSARGIAARTDQRTVGLLVLIGLMWLTHLTLPSRTGEPGLDTSWQEVKGYELVHGWQVGVDTVFTFGPLGYFHVAPYNADLFWTKVVWWELAFKLCLTCILVSAVRRMGGPIEKSVFLLALLILYPGQDGFFFTMVIAISIRVLDEPRRTGPRAAFGFLLLALIALIKFTFFTLVSLSVALIVVQRAWAVSWRSAARTAALYGLILVLVWTLLGQSPLHLPRYLQSSLWIASGYNEGMTWIGPAHEVKLAYAIVLSIGAVALLQGLQRPRDRTVWITAALLCAGSFVSLKAGFVRHSGNSITFFGCAALSTFLLPALEPRSGRERSLRGLQTMARVACALMASYGCALSQGVATQAPTFWVGRFVGELTSHAEILLDLPSYRARLAHHRQTMEGTHALPRIRAAVGRETVDVFGCNQSMALLNDLNYHPRPVFQSYSAYTPELMELNARFFESERAPRFVLFEQGSLDYRLPGSEDGLALQVLMRDYRPVFSEAGILLLERASVRTAHAADRRRVVLDTTIGFGEKVDLDRLHESDGIEAAGGTKTGEHSDSPGPRRETGRPCYLVAVDIRPTLWGRLRATLLKGSPVFMNCTLASGEIGTYRVLPGVLRTGTLVDPFIDRQDFWVRWFGGEPVSRITSFSVSTHAEFQGCFAPRIGLRVVRDDSLAPEIEPEVAAKIAYSMFSRAPEYVRSNPPPSRQRLDNLEALVVQAPSEMGFAVGPGKHSIEARFGLIPQAFESECTDGAEFSVVARDGAGAETVLFRERIDKSSESRALTHSLDLEFDARTPARILFRVDSGPQGDAACDWAYWSGVSIVDADTGTALK